MEGFGQRQLSTLGPGSPNIICLCTKLFPYIKVWGLSKYYIGTQTLRTTYNMWVVILGYVLQPAITQVWVSITLIITTTEPPSIRHDSKLEPQTLTQHPKSLKPEHQDLHPLLVANVITTTYRSGQTASSSDGGFPKSGGFIGFRV